MKYLTSAKVWRLPFKCIIIHQRRGGINMHEITLFWLTVVPINDYSSTSLAKRYQLYKYTRRSQTLAEEKSSSQTEDNP